MRRSLSYAVAAAIAAATFVPVAAGADDRHGGYSDRREYRGDRRDDRRDYRQGYNNHHHDKDDDGDAIVAGVVGLALGAIIASAVVGNDRAAKPDPYYDAPPRPHPYQGGPYQSGYDYPAYAPPHGYSDRVCIVREKQWDPYVRRTLTIERRVSC